MNKLKEWKEEVEKGCGDRCPQKVSKHDGSKWLCIECEQKLETMEEATQIFEDDLDEVMKKLKEELEKDTKFNVLTFDFVFDKIDKLKKEFKNKLKEARG